WIRQSHRVFLLAQYLNLLSHRGISRAIQQTLQVSGIVSLELENPGIKRGFVDQMRRIGQSLVELHQLARHRSVNVGSGLHRFHHARCCTASQTSTGSEVTNKHQITQLVLSKVGNANQHDTVFILGPLVAYYVLSISWQLHIASLTNQPTILLISKAAAKTASCRSRSFT